MRIKKIMLKKSYENKYSQKKHKTMNKPKKTIIALQIILESFDYLQLLIKRTILIRTSLDHNKFKQFQTN